MLVELCVQVCTVPLGMCNMDFSEMVSVCCVCVCVCMCLNVAGKKLLPLASIVST